MAPPPCRFFQAGRCRSGDECKYSHSTRTQAEQSPNSSTSASSSTWRRPPNQSQLPGASSPLPNGVCRYYWETGACKREFDCRYQHDRCDEGSKTRLQRPQFNLAANDAIAPFLTEQGLAKMNGISTDGFFEDETLTSLSPTDAHNHFKKFLSDTFQFKTSYEVYSFLVPLSSANCNNALWTQEEGQTNGSLRVAEIINWSQISICAGLSRGIVSFQRGILPLLRYLSSEFVVKSTMSTNANHLFSIVLQNFEKFADRIEECMHAAINASSFKDTRSKSYYKPIDTQIFVSIAGVLHEFLVRFKNAVATYPRLSPLVNNLHHWFQDWHAGAKANPPLFDNPLNKIPPAVREHVVDSIRERIKRLVNIVEREESKLINLKSDLKQKRKAAADAADRFSGSVLHATYEGPGHLRPDGPRHDNDFEDIYEIRIAPTQQELMIRIPPFLPANFYSAPHPAPADSMQRLLDIQFRLLREELTASLRQAVHEVHDDLKSKSLKNTKLGDLLDKKGGRYHGQAGSQDSVMFNVYSGVRFLSLVPGWKGISTSLLVDTPPGRARADRPAQRAAFWESMSGKRLFQGGLIALIWESGGDVSVHLGIIATSTRDLSDYVKQDKEHVKFGVVFFDPSLELQILEELRHPHTSRKGIKILIESPVMFEAIRPFLEALRTEPEDVPFSRYLVLQPHERLASCALEAPRYARLPKFHAGVENLMLSATDPVSIAYARKMLKSKSRLDPSQVDAVIDTLTREVALIQGPPGTGKSFTGVEIIRVLKANKVRPILLIAFTNHALDHMLSSILDAHITQRIVRLGRRVTEGPIAQYSMEALETAHKDSRLHPGLGFCWRELKVVEAQIRRFMRKVLNNYTDHILGYLSVFYPKHFARLFTPPPLISKVKRFVYTDEDDEEEWQTVGRGSEALDDALSTYAFWRDSSDLAFIDQITNGSFQPWKFPPGVKNLALTVEPVDDNHSSDEELSDTETCVEKMEVEESWKVIQFDQVSPISSLDPLCVLPPISKTRPPLPVEIINRESTIGPADAKDMDGFFLGLGFDHTPSIPHSDRPLEELLEDVGDVWEMSVSERQRLHAEWAGWAQTTTEMTYMDEFKRLRDRHADKLRQCNEGKEEVRRSLLHSMDIIACTTTGRSFPIINLNLAHSDSGLSPKVLLVEEAGQVMEAHILGSLVPSIEHLILIGDPLQLRPTLNNYSLSVESKQGQIYKFDMSLMERLSTSGFPMSHIDVQRRMRPMISSLIRNTLYPSLEDHKLVKEYPDVRGIQHNVFFVSHSHHENEGGDDSGSKYNMYEVCKFIINHLANLPNRQGCYSKEGDIVVLCAYIGQLARLRDALANDVAISIGERDWDALADQESDLDEDVIDGATIKRVNVTKRVRLRTVDNYQGEEGRIVILSLVRNSGDPEDENGGHPHRANIGFLKSENRTNVALSRAREGLYIFGHAQNLSSRSGMWGKIIEELEEKSLVGPALPIACHRHPDVVKYVSEPGQLPQFAPDGGCLEKCGSRLDCGHLCPFKPCRRLCARDHPCQKHCRYDCGQCQFKVANVQLPCGHTKASVPCWQLDSLGEVFCDFKMEKDLPSCEHTAIMSCGQDPSDYSCLARCDRLMECCSKICRSRCHECQTENVKQEDGKVARARHQTHPCEKRLHCSHPCRAECSSSHEHTKQCMERCRQSCQHAHCQLACSEPCDPCQEACGWNCDHYSCPVPCGSICVRLPCDKPCKRSLKCGHACPSVCGEDCNIQVCPECASANQKSQVVDLVLQRSLEDVLPESGDIDEMIITIPACRHVFTVETLDGLTGMNDFYSRDINNTKWTGLLAPLGFTNPPTCPTCRSPITCPRYGRIVKRADLDILERNVAAHMSQSLDSRQQALQGINEGALKALLAAEAATITIPEPKDPPKLAKQKTSRKKLLGTGKSPASERDIQASNSTLHFMDSKVLSIWRKATHQLFAVYKDIVKITERRYAHTQAWEASLSLLFEREIQAGLENPATLPRNPQEHAMRMARIYIGQPRPLADRRFLVEAFWVTLHIRLTLIGLAQTWMYEVNKHSGRYSAFHLQQWLIYIDFLLQTCVRDAEKAYDIARDSESYRQIMKSRLLRMRIDLEIFRFNLLMCRHYGTIKDHREGLLVKVDKLGAEAIVQMNDTVKTHLAQKEIQSLEEEMVWVEDNFTSTAETIVSEWMEMKRSIERDSVYQPVSLDEQMQIIRAMNFAATGHFYQCANGHTFVITECGGAMKQSTCPECGAVIGGSNHRLDDSNTRSDEFDRLAQTLNPHSGGSPWANPY
ncbi:hypothetical protein BYT27DRAFT_7188610 [Phlegmacium glaucopus]|nr:hypothetical protein BYT27DRAFT_7188610 [Phlegmacium glaucopus]